MDVGEIGEETLEGGASKLARAKEQAPELAHHIGQHAATDEAKEKINQRSEAKEYPSTHKANSQAEFFSPGK